MNASRDLARCTLDDLAEEAERTITVLHQIDERQAAARGKAGDWLGVQLDALRERRDLIEAIAARCIPDTPAAALFQLVLLFSDVSDIAEGPPSPAQETRECVRRASARLYSLRRYLEQMSGRPVGDLLSDFYMLTEHDPHRAVDEAFAAELAQGAAA